MEINYELIIKHLANNTSHNSFDTKKNLMTFSDKFPKEFNELFGDKFYRLGITQKIDNNKLSSHSRITIHIQFQVLRLFRGKRLRIKDIRLKEK